MNDMALRTFPSVEFNVRRALVRAIEQSEYRSFARAVASFTLSADPDTVEQTNPRNVFRCAALTAGRLNVRLCRDVPDA